MDEVLPLGGLGYSLEPDMLKGWTPKNLKSIGPIPLEFP